MSEVKICPTCGQKIKSTTLARICGECGKPIQRHHKFYFDGSVIKHRVCDDPESYVRGGR